MAFLASDTAVHNLLAKQTVEKSIELQVALGQIRKSAGEFPARILAIDPHRMHSYSKRHMRRRKPAVEDEPTKCSQAFFCLDSDSHQPVAFVLGGPAASIQRATIQLLDICRQILNPSAMAKPLVLADTEHNCWEIFSHARREQAFDLLCPMQRQPAILRGITSADPSHFQPRWAGYATANFPYQFRNDKAAEAFHMIVQRCGETPDQYNFKPFVATRSDDPVQQLTVDFPQRWRIEEFFKNYQDLGWSKAGTFNLNIRYGQMTMALLAQAAIANLRKRLDQPMASWDSLHLAKELFAGLDGDVRVEHQTIIVTYYNAPHALKAAFQGMPQKLEREGIRPNIPWLYDFKIDFRFR